MLSEIVASRVAFALSPATPALSEEEIVMGSAFLLLLVPNSFQGYGLWLNRPLTGDWALRVYFWRNRINSNLLLRSAIGFPTAGRLSA